MTSQLSPSEKGGCGTDRSSPSLHLLGASALTVLLLACAAGPAQASVIGAPAGPSPWGYIDGMWYDGAWTPNAGNAKFLPTLTSTAASVSEGTSSISPLTGASLSMAATVSGGNQPYLALSASAASTGAPHVDDFVWATTGVVGQYYWFMAYDPTGYAGLVPVDVSFKSGYQFTATGSGAYGAGGALSFDGRNAAGANGTYNFAFDYANSGYDPGFPALQNLEGQHVVSTYVFANQWNKINMKMYLEAHAACNNCAFSPAGAGNVEVSAFIDPTVTLDPSWQADPGSYIAFSSLAPAVSGIAEPASLAVLAIGLGAMPFVPRRNRKHDRLHIAP